MPKKNKVNYICPDWEDFPDIYLYMDQVISILEKYLSPFSEEKSITSTMINNYVKQKIITPPQNKKYSREQIAVIFMVCILKRFMQLNDINILISELCENRGIKEVFKIFKSEFEECMNVVFNEDTANQKEDNNESIKVLKSSLMAFSYIIKSRDLFNEEKQKLQKTPKPKEK